MQVPKLVRVLKVVAAIVIVVAATRFALDGQIARAVVGYAIGAFFVFTAFSKMWNGIGRPRDPDRG